MGVRLRRSTTVALAVCAAAIATAAQAQKMPPGSYLRKPVTTGTDIAQQVKKDRLVAERYSRIFRLSPETIGKAVSKLKLSKLREDRVMRVYYVHKGERLGYKVRRVPAGTAVFVSTDGTPAFVKACGNPLRPDLDAGMTASLTKPSVRKFSPQEPLDAAVMSGDAAQVSSPETDVEGRVVGEAVASGVGDTAIMSIFVEEVDAADQLVTVSTPKGDEDTHFLDWYRQRGSRVAGITTHTMPTPPVPGGPTTTGLPRYGGTTYIPGTVGVPRGPIGPYTPIGSSSMGAAHAPEPGVSAMIGAGLIGSLAAFARRRRRETK